MHANPPDFFFHLAPTGSKVNSHGLQPLEPMVHTLEPMTPPLVIPMVHPMEPMHANPPRFLLSSRPNGATVNSHGLQPLEPMVHTLEPMVHTLEPMVHTLEPMVHTLEPMTHPLEPMVHPLEPMPANPPRFLLSSRPNGATVNSHGLQPLEPMVHTLEPMVHTLEPMVHTLEPMVHTLEPMVHPLEPMHANPPRFLLSSRPNGATVNSHGLQPLDPMVHPLEPMVHTLEPMIHTLEPMIHALKSTPANPPSFFFHLAPTGRRSIAMGFSPWNQCSYGPARAPTNQPSGTALGVIRAALGVQSPSSRTEPSNHELQHRLLGTGIIREIKTQSTP